MELIKFGGNEFKNIPRFELAGNLDEEFYRSIIEGFMSSVSKDTGFVIIDGGDVGQKSIGLLAIDENCAIYMFRFFDKAQKSSEIMSHIIGSVNVLDRLSPDDILAKYGNNQKMSFEEFFKNTTGKEFNRQKSTKKLIIAKNLFPPEITGSINFLIEREVPLLAFEFQIFGKGDEKFIVLHQNCGGKIPEIPSKPITEPEPDSEQVIID